MTLSPMEDRNVVGLDGKPHDLPEACGICGKGGELQRHHIWRRSDVIGDRWWVYVPSQSRVYGNCVKLCNQCHDQITNGYAKLEWDGDILKWGSLHEAAHHMLWQPPIYLVDEMEGGAWELGINRDWNIDGHELILYPQELSRHDSPSHDPNFCYACHRKLPKPKDETLEEKKVRKTWSVAVPVDSQENGADVLDTLVEEARKELFDAGLPYGESDTAKYHVMCTALALFIQNAGAMAHG